MSANYGPGAELPDQAGRDGRWTVIERSAGPSDRDRLASDVRRGFTMDPPTLPARWFYDEKGSLLFDEITELAEYYPTRTEEAILTDHAAETAERTGATTMVELGSGMSRKTRLLLDAMSAGGRELLVVPLDISSEVLADSAQRLAAAYPNARVEAVVADFNEPFGPLPGTPGSRLVAFLGGTIGNFDRAERAAFLSRLAAELSPGDHFLLGADLVKDPARLVAAYDDALGVTAAFNLNLIEVLARQLDATGLMPEDFEHEARWNADESRIEMWLRARRAVHAEFRAINLDWTLPEGASVLTEISVKFDVPSLQRELVAAGLAVEATWTDDAGDFSLTLSRR